MLKKPPTKNPQTDIHQARINQFSILTERLQRGGTFEASDIMSWCRLGLMIGQHAMVREFCRKLLADKNAAPEQRPYWFYFLGGALFRQLELDKGVAVLRQGLEALCNFQPAYTPKPEPKKFDTPQIEELLWKTLALLAGNGVRAFPHAGTLLGLIREKKLLPFDKDLDLGLMIDELPLAHSTLTTNGWQRSYNSIPITNIVSYYHPEIDITLDLCGKEAESDGSNSILGGFRVNNGTPLEWQRISRFPPLLLEIHTHPAGKIWQLQEPESWLAAMYGKSWRVPDPDFDTVIGAYNLVGFSTLTRWYAYSRIMDPWLRGYWEKALKLSQLVLERYTPDDPLLLKVAEALETNIKSLSLPS
jgi:hypothetical protein